MLAFINVSTVVVAAGRDLLMHRRFLYRMQMGVAKLSGANSENDFLSKSENLDYKHK